MKKPGFTIIIIGCIQLSLAQYAPPAGQPGSTAIYKDSTILIDWASGCTVERGLKDISSPSAGYVTYGEDSNANGIAGENGIISLGDGGTAILTFDTPIANGDGYDFAVFENAFNDLFLELAFVEISSDGEQYYRFNSVSLTQTNVQVDGFGQLDATKIHNLAGKYRAAYGVPFDLSELEGKPGLNLNNITQVKIIDVVGCIQSEYASYDSEGNIINDPWSTPFESGGFDLDAVGVIHNITNVSVNTIIDETSIEVFPNPCTDYLMIKMNAPFWYYEIIDITGRIVLDGSIKDNRQMIETISLQKGLYLLTLKGFNTSITKKIIKK